MSLIALAHVLNDKEVTKEKGWEHGYRLIDASTEELLDISVDRLIVKIADNSINVSNLKVTDNNGIEVLYLETCVWDDLATIGVSKDEEYVVKVHGVNKNASVKEMLFILSQGNLADDDIGLLRITDIFGHRILQVCFQELFEIEKKIVNKSAERLYDVGECRTYNLCGVYNAEARDFANRSKLLAGDKLYFADKLDGGVRLYGVESRGERLIIPDFITEIKAYTRLTESNVKRITLGKGVKVLDLSVFYEVELEELELNEGLEEIRSGAFWEWTLHGDLVIPSSLKKVGRFGLGQITCNGLVVKADKMSLEGDKKRDTDDWLSDWYRYSFGECKLAIVREAAFIFIERQLGYNRRLKKMRENTRGSEDWIQDTINKFNTTPRENWRPDVLGKLSDKQLSRLLEETFKILYNSGFSEENEIEVEII